MNAKRLAQLYLEQARILQEIAAELDSANDTEPPRKSRVRRLPAKPTAEDHERVTEALRRAGIATDDY